MPEVCGLYGVFAAACLFQENALFLLYFGEKTKKMH